uniref:ribosomal protein L19 n=1 Tax=Prototheca moriformis TaxID=183676 RepID=UPI0030022144
MSKYFLKNQTYFINYFPIITQNQNSDITNKKKLLIKNKKKLTYSLNSIPFYFLKELKKNKNVRILYFNEDKLTFFKGQIFFIHKAGALSMLGVQNKKRGFFTNKIFPIFAPFIKQIEILF